jgi:hypothetical protein
MVEAVWVVVCVWLEMGLNLRKDAARADVSGTPELRCDTV